MKQVFPILLSPTSPIGFSSMWYFSSLILYSYIGKRTYFIWFLKFFFFLFFECISQIGIRLFSIIDSKLRSLNFLVLVINLYLWFFQTTDHGTRVTIVSIVLKWWLVNVFWVRAFYCLGIFLYGIWDRFWIVRIQVVICSFIDTWIILVLIDEGVEYWTHFPKMYQPFLY